MVHSIASRTTRHYTVQGLTCDHCVLSVREEVSEVAGVESFDIDLAPERLTVTGHCVDDAAVADAVEDAGYRVVL